MAVVKTYFAGDTVTVGTIVKDLLDVQTNPTNGVTVTIKDNQGQAQLTDQVCTQGQWDEDNDDATGQYYHAYQTGSDDSGTWTAEFTIDPGGSLEGFDIVEFILE